MKFIKDIMDSLSNTDEWDSLVIDRRKPVTFRLFRQLNDTNRVCLHKFMPCKAHECISHPHPWPATFLVLDGKYKQTLGWSEDLESLPQTVSKMYCVAGTLYSIMDRRTWHKIQPIVPTYSLMINEAPWDNPHKCVRTTKGKDLKKIDTYFKEELCYSFLRLLKIHFESM